MKKTIFFLVFTIIIKNCFSQQRIPLCSIDKGMYNGRLGTKDSVTHAFLCGFTNTEKAYHEIEKIMNLAKFPMNFTVCKTIKLNNAFAALDSNGIRYIVYDDAFLSSLDTDSSRLESVTALSHEIGHHLSGHTLSLINYDYRKDTAKFCTLGSNSYNKIKCDDVQSNYLKESRKQELEADKFAGFIMNRYGASLQQISNLYHKITSDYNDSLSDHPNLSKRLGAIKVGFELAELYQGANITFVDIEKIKGRKIDIDIPDLSRIKRNKIIENITNCIISSAPDYVVNSIKGQELIKYTGGSIVNQDKIIQYIGTKTNSCRIDEANEYFGLISVFIGLRYDEKVSFRPQPAIHIKNGYLDILVFGVNDKLRVVYHVPFKEDKISLEEIKVIFIEIFRNGILREIERYNSKD